MPNKVLAKTGILLFEFHTNLTLIPRFVHVNNVDNPQREPDSYSFILLTSSLP